MQPVYLLGYNCKALTIVMPLAVHFLQALALPLQEKVMSWHLAGPQQTSCS
jgi:hypothetical protein